MPRTYYNILHWVSKSDVIDNGDLHAANSLILNAVKEGLNIQRASIWLLTDNRQIMQCQLLIDGTNAQPETPHLHRQDYPIYFAALDQDRAIMAHDAQNDESMCELRDDYLIPLGITALLDAPIHHRGEMTGIVSCEHQGSPRIWTDNDVAFVSALADLYGRALSAEQRNNYERQLQLSNEQLEQKVKERTQWLEDALRNLTHTQAKLIESEKLASVGRMVSGLAHEINTPLGIAVTSASHCESEVKKMQNLYLQGELEEEDFKRFLLSLTEGITLVSHNLTRAANLVQNFKLTGSTQTASEEEEFELNNCLDIIIKSLQPLLKQHKLIYHRTHEPVHLCSYPGALAQIITNLVTNSIHHGFANKEQGHIDIHVAVQQEQVHLSYSDDGAGIAADIQDKVFEPFFTTARKTGGSGLGLSIVYNLVTQKLRGRINMEAGTEAGARFVISFPISVAAPVQ